MVITPGPLAAISYDPIVSIDLGPLSISPHGIFTAVGVLAGAMLLMRQVWAAGLDEEAVTTVLTRAVVAALLGARAAYVLNHVLGAWTLEEHGEPVGADAVGTVLSRAGFEPGEVTHAVLTHLHFDHVGGLCDLPNATVVVQGREWAELADERLVSSGAVNPDDVDLGHRRVVLDGDRDLFGDGSITCLLTDGHTAGHQSVRVRAFDTVYVLCGDCCYLQRTLTHEHLPPFAWDHGRQRASIRRLAAEQRDGATLMFGHDPDQMDRIMRDGLGAWV